MEFIRIESVQGHNLRIVVEVTVEEYNQIVNERNRRAEVERQNEQDRQRERQWYADNEYLAST